MSVELHESRVKRFVIAVTTRSLAAFLVLSFLAALLPAGTVVAQSIMACCRGKAAGHCHAGFKPKQTTSISSTCNSDCCARCAPAQQSKRERSAAQTVIKVTSPATTPRSFEKVTVLVPSWNKWVSINPRGPPLFFVEQIS